MDPLALLSGDPEAFIRDVWGRRILVHEVEPARLEGIFDIGQADHLITETAMRTPQLRLAKSGSVLPESRFTKQASIAGKPMTGLIDGRKELVKGYRRFGFVCAQCDKRRQARRAAKAQKLIKEAA